MTYTTKAFTIEGYTVKEAAKLLGVTQSNIYAKVKMLRKKGINVTIEELTINHSGRPLKEFKNA